MLPRSQATEHRSDDVEWQTPKIQMAIAEPTTDPAKRRLDDRMDDHKRAQDPLALGHIHCR
jgi:hypothetical protein